MKLLIEIDGPVNQGWSAPFLAQTLRGRFDYARVREPMAAMELANFPFGIPGQRVMIDTEKGVGAVLDPLHDDRNADLRKKLASKLGIGGMNCVIPKDDVVKEYPNLGAKETATWLYWMRRAVQGGHAKLIQGDLPTDAQVAGARRDFHGHEQKVDESVMLRRMEVAAKMAVMNPEERREYERLLASPLMDSVN